LLEAASSPEDVNPYFLRAQPQYIGDLAITELAVLSQGQAMSLGFTETVQCCQKLLSCLPAPYRELLRRRSICDASDRLSRSVCFPKAVYNQVVGTTKEPGSRVFDSVDIQVKAKEGLLDNLFAVGIVPTVDEYEAVKIRKAIMVDLLEFSGASLHDSVIRRLRCILC